MIRIQPIGRMLLHALLALSLAFGMPVPQGRAATTLLPNGKQCFSATVGINGMIGTLGTPTAGTSGTTGTYSGIAFTGGSGTGATGTFVVSGGGVTAVTVLAPGIQFVVGDVLSASSANIGGVSGFSVTVLSTAINGSLAAGTVAMYVPNTTTPKQTWQDAGQVTANTNPITLDSNGCALIYGTGSYRQQLFDSLGNLVWDAVTTDTSATNNTFWAGIAGGTPNAITVTDAGFNATDGSIIQFIPIADNTGPTTLNPSGFGNISIVKDTTGGPVALSGGEIAVAAGGNGNVVQVVYSAAQANFHILNLISAAPSASTPICGAVGLKITNDATFPNSKVDITATQIVMRTVGGQYISRGSPASPISLTVNFTTTGANGFDGNGSFTNSTWYNIYAIDNGIAPAALGSISATAPTLPSGYSYACRLGAMTTAANSSSIAFELMLQLRNYNEYQLTAASNTVGQPVIQKGVAGTPSESTPTWVTPTTIGNGFCAPPTATQLVVIGNSNYKAASSSFVQAAPSTAYGGFENANGSVAPIDLDGSSPPQTTIFQVEGTTVAYAGNSAGAALLCQGFYDSVNAN